MDFYYMTEGRTKPSRQGQSWSGETVKSILRNEVYVGHMVQNKIGIVSYKKYKQVEKRKEEWIKMENTYEPQITQETWDASRRASASSF